MEDSKQIKNLLSMVFQVARYEFPNQPLTATPSVSVQEFSPDFDYKDALIHGHYNGWNKLIFKGVSNPELCNYIWALSDVVSFDSKMAMPETGWLLNIANRYGRPIICTNWQAPEGFEIKPTLDLFSKNKVFWYYGGEVLSKNQIQAFQFSRISTPRR